MWVDHVHIVLLAQAHNDRRTLGHCALGALEGDQVIFLLLLPICRERTGWNTSAIAFAEEDSNDRGCVKMALFRSCGGCASKRCGFCGANGAITVPIKVIATVHAPSYFFILASPGMSTVRRLDIIGLILLKSTGADRASRNSSIHFVHAACARGGTPRQFAGARNHRGRTEALLIGSKLYPQNLAAFPTQTRLLGLDHERRKRLANLGGA